MKKFTCSYFFVFVFFALISVNAVAQVSPEISLAHAKAQFAAIEANQAFADNLSHVDMNNLPMGVHRTISNMSITIAVSEAVFHTTHTSASVFARILIPEKDQTLFFGVQGVSFSTEGNLIGDVKLTLLETTAIPTGSEKIMLRVLGGFDEDTGIMANLTYVQVDCQGFRSLRIAGEVELAPGLFQYVNARGEVDNTRNVTAHFQTEIYNWNDIIAQLSFPNFAIRGLDGFIWNLQDVVFDFSDHRNAANMFFPPGYAEFLTSNRNLWRGIFARELRITLPPQFSTSDDRRVSFAANNLIIDDNGVTGVFSAHNILSFDQGDASGWAFSVDYFAIELLANNLERAAFAGEIGLPISSDRLAYSGFFTADNEYVLKVQTLNNLSFDFLFAQATLLPNSHLKFRVEDGRFRPEAMLHGHLSMPIRMGDNEVSNIDRLEFRSLRLQTQAPYMQIGSLGYSGEIRLMNFPVSIQNIAMTTTGNRAILGMNVDLTLADGMFSGGTRIEIIGEMENGGLHRWRYQTTRISDIRVDATVNNMFRMRGGLIIKRDDPIYGNGFGGSLAVDFLKPPVEGMSISMSAMFGRTEFRYWYVSGSAVMPGRGIAMGTGVFLTGFNGSIAQRMSARPGGGGVRYVPDENTALRLQSSIIFVGVDNNLLHCEAGFKISFNQHGGLRYAGIFGFGKFLGSIPGLDNLERAIGERYNSIIAREQAFIDNNPERIEQLSRLRQFNPHEAARQTFQPSFELGTAGMTASVGLLINFEDWSIHGSLNLYANVAGGMITGVGTNNRAGWAVFHVNNYDWYLHVGTPHNPIGLRMGFGNILAVETRSYFMVGTRIYNPPGVPQQVASILQTSTNLNFMDNLSAIQGGSGVAFGSQLHINTGDITFLILYANFGMGVGFDIMLRNYGNAQCAGRSGTIGINGWYASGQAYAYMSGELGVAVNLRFIRKRVPIIRGEVATLMQAQLPNPTFLQAFLAVRFEVLGGLVRGNLNFEMAIGEQCQILRPGESPVDFDLISDISPANAESSVSVFAAPQVRFAIGVGKQFEARNQGGQMQLYRVQLNEFTLRDESGQIIAGTMEWNESRDALSFYSFEVLPPEENISLAVVVTFEEWRTGQWRTVYTSGVQARESRTLSFRTSDAPNYIPLSNVEYSYPVIDQRYFLQGESRNGFIQLRRGQAYLFPDGFEYVVAFQSARGEVKQAPFTYNQSRQRIDFTIPQLAFASAYSIQLLAKNQDGESVEAITEVERLTEDEQGTLEVERRLAGQEIRDDVGNLLLAYEFGTSRYNTFAEKVQGLTRWNAILHTKGSIIALGFHVRDMEPFDMAELAGTRHTQNRPLVQVSATLQEPFFVNTINPLIYNNQQLRSSNINITNRNTAELGFPPVRAININSQYLTYVESGNFTNRFLTERFPFIYNLFSTVRADFINIQGQVLHRYKNNTANPLYRQFVTYSFPRVPGGNYIINLQYVLPDGTKGTNANFTFFNHLQ